MKPMIKVNRIEFTGPVRRIWDGDNAVMFPIGNEVGSIYGDGRGLGGSEKESAGIIISDKNLNGAREIWAKPHPHGWKSYGAVAVPGSNSRFYVALGRSADPSANDSTTRAWDLTDVWQYNTAGKILGKATIERWHDNGPTHIHPCFIENMPGPYLYSVGGNMWKRRWGLSYGGYTLGRVPWTKVMNPDAWQWWRGGKWPWAWDLFKARPMFGLYEGLVAAAEWIDELGSILLYTQHTKNARSNFSIFQSRWPSGPWMPVYWGKGKIFEDGKPENAFTLRPVPFTKRVTSIPGGGLKIKKRMVITGSGENDKFCFRDMTIWAGGKN